MFLRCLKPISIVRMPFSSRVIVSWHSWLRWLTPKKIKKQSSWAKMASRIIPASHAPAEQQPLRWTRMQTDGFLQVCWIKGWLKFIRFALRPARSGAYTLPSLTARRGNRPPVYLWSVLIESRYAEVAFPSRNTNAPRVPLIPFSQSFISKWAL